MKVAPLAVVTALSGIAAASVFMYTLFVFMSRTRSMLAQNCRRDARRPHRADAVAGER